jgi:hypothetical protein
MTAVWKAADRIHVRLSEEERAFLARLPEVVGGVESDPADPAAARMRPEAYPGDGAASREFSRLTSGELTDARRVDAEAFTRSLSEAESEGISLEQAESWLRLLGDARLVLAAREGIVREGELPDPSAANPRLALVHYLGALQNEIVEVLMTTMVDST